MASGAGMGAGAGARKRGRPSKAQFSEMDLRVLAVVERHPEGCPNSVLQREIPDTAQLVSSLNRLVQEKHRIELLQGSGGEVMYRAVDEELATKLEGLTRDDMHILQHIERAHDMGIWIKDLKRLTGLQQQTLNKSLKRMMGRRLVKKVSSKTYKQRKLYMMFDVEPSRELTGGAMYTSDTMELDHDFIKSLRKFVLTVLKRTSGPCSVAHMMRKLDSAGISTVKLSAEEMQQILDTLEYDGRIKRVDPRLSKTVEEDDDEAASTTYELAQQITVPDALTATPCGVCPVVDDCTPGGVISPATCVYLDKWLEF